MSFLAMFFLAMSFLAMYRLTAQQLIQSYVSSAWDVKCLPCAVSLHCWLEWASLLHCCYAHLSAGLSLVEVQSLFLQRGFDRQQLAIAHTCQVYAQQQYDQSSVVQHPLSMYSAYAQVTEAEPDYTSCHDKFFGTVDYIWYSTQVWCKPVKHHKVHMQKLQYAQALS